MSMFILLATVLSEQDETPRSKDRSATNDGMLSVDRDDERGPAYLLFPMSMITMFGFEFCFASSSQRVKWLNVSRRVMS